jgi:hypothetical protein
MPLWFTLVRKTASVSRVAVVEKSPGQTKIPRDPANRPTGRSKRLGIKPKRVRSLLVSTAWLKKVIMATQA